jgi:hypothetical protein
VKTPPAYVRRTLDHWTSEGIAFPPGLTTSELRQIEVDLKAETPDQMRLLYEYANGNDVQSAAADEHGFRFMRLQDCVRSEVETWLLVFCDLMYGVALFSIDLGDGAGYGRGSVCLLQNEWLVVATSFEEFMDLYVSGSSRLTPHGAEELHRRLMEEREKGAKD